MKQRNGFVSNSSSSSFIVPPERKDVAEQMGLKLTSIAELIKLKNRIDEMGVDFIFNYCGYGMEELKKMPENYYISAPYDRDVAYEKGISDMFSLFQGDL